MNEHGDYHWNYGQAPGALAYILPGLYKLLTVPPPARVLDVGCGNGWVAGQLADRGYKVTGVDPSDSGLEYARESFPSVRFEPLYADERVLENLGEEPFDAVVSTEVVEHLYAPEKWASGCLNALRPGGILVCSTPYHGRLKNTLIAAAGKHDFHYRPTTTGGHIKFFSRATLTDLLTTAGFEVQEFLGTGRVPYVWKSMLLSARRPM